MLKHDQLRDLKAQAETGDDPLVWQQYARALEEKLRTPHSTMLWEPNETEMTEDSATAHADAITTIIEGDQPLTAAPVEIIHDQAADFTYAIEVRGQRSATAHGKQGLRPARAIVLDALDRSGLPVLLAFRDGAVWQTAWWAELPEPSSISRGDDGAKERTARIGWPVKEFRRASELLLPTEYKPREPAQGKLA